MTPLRVAVVGTGRMGGAMAARVSAAGHALTVFNRTRSTAEVVATQCDGDVAVDVIRIMVGWQIVAGIAALALWSFARRR